eukprot:gene10981-11062_t
MLDIVDIHTHVISPDTVGYPLNPLGGKQSGWSTERPTTGDMLLAEMDAAGVSQSAVVQAATAYSYDNSYLAHEVAAHDRFTGVFTIDVQAPDAAAAFSKWVKAGLTGMRLFTTGSTSPGQAGWLADPATFPIWEMAQEANIPVCLQMQPEGEVFLRVLLDRFKKVPIILDHLARVKLAGGPPYDGAKWLFDLADHPNLYLKLTSRTVEQSAEKGSTPEEFFPRIVAAYGANRIAWGSNFPAHHGPMSHLVDAAKAALSCLGTDDQAEIFAGTARRLSRIMSTTKLTAAIGFRAWRENIAREQAGETAFQLDFVDIEPIHRAFAPMARELRFDVSEMAVVTALQALGYGKKLILLPVTLAARFQHGCLIRLAGNDFAPGDLVGKKIGVRAYTQTTGVWVRGILENDYGVPARSVQWITQEGAHLAEYENPSWVKQAEDNRPLVDMLRSGEIDAAILGNDLPDDPDFVPVIADPKAAAAAWYASHHVIPSNHVMVVRADVAERDPEAVRALWQCLLRAKPAPKGGFDFAALGIEANRPPVEMLLKFCEQQSLLPRAIAFDELYAPAKALLGL